MASTQHLLYLGLHIVDNVFVLSLHRNALYIGNAHHTVLRRSQRNINYIVLVHTHAALALALQYADNLKRSLVDTHNLAYRIFLREKAVRNRLADYGHSAAAAKVTVAQNAAILNLQTGNRKAARRCTLYAARPVLVACNQLIASVDAGRNVGNAVHLLFDGLHIVICQLDALTGRQACTARGTAAGGDNQQIAAQLGDIVFYILLEAKA